ncbi:helix-turn-helix transcriptional regulator [Nocardioides sp. CFH 31398]|uniref:helix-turn-helix transcriptional regulator n=1 Tax=Nocardioides sp. CFH 31398 TaxID=2919579 RepID=UPI001F053457|nr:helix-turn-helix transcriptional regulator [Nocardioides sp. CFH 31398]MCH1865334.1 helix-turn-helix transcriptional regulator [Nocardioides sp. CFH 31398]
MSLAAVPTLPFAERVLVLACSARRDAARRAGPLGLRARVPGVVLEAPAAAVEVLLAELLPTCRAPVGAGLEVDVDVASEAGQGVVRAAEFLLAELDRPGGLATCAVARAELERYVLTRVLLGGRHRWAEALADHDDRSRLGRLAPVVAYVEEHADAELTPELLARVGCVSVRTLHAAFAERLGVPPMAYVRTVRLARVRAELLAGDPDGVRVTDVATRWGFFHQSRFAQQYRERFGELPSQTLAR